VAGGTDHRIWKISAKKGCFLSFEWEKTNFAIVGPPRKILEKSPSVSHLENALLTPMSRTTFLDHFQQCN